MTGAIAVGVLSAAGVYLILQRGLVRIAIGFVLLTHALNVLLVLAAGDGGAVPAIAPWAGPPADPLARALALTSIVIGFGTTIFLLALALRHALTTQDDDTEDADG
jgi:multicomponent Na+:H+ antiporter subunit C